MAPQKNYEVRIPFCIVKEPHKADTEKQVLNFISKLGKPVAKYCLVQFINGNLVFSIPDCPKKLTVRPASFLEDKNISRVCSKFNMVSSIASTSPNCKYTLSVVDAEMEGQSISDTKVLKMTLEVNDPSAEMALSNIFFVIDKS